MRNSFYYYRGMQLFVILCKLDSVLWMHNKCDCYIRADYSALFGIFIFCD